MFTVGRGWKGWFVERVSDAGVVSPGSPGGSRHFLRSCWIFLTTVVTLSCVASVCFTYFVKWANTTATNFLVALIYILTNAFCLWSIGCNRLSPSHWLCYCGGGQPQRWIWNDMKNECRFRKGRDVGFKSDTFKRRICEVSMGGHQCAVLLLLYTLLNVTTFWFLVLERQTHARHGARSIIEFFLLTLWFHTIRHLACPRSLLLQTFTIVYHIFHIVYVPGSLNASTFAMVWIRHNQKDFELGKSHPDFPLIPSASPSSRPGAPELPTQGLICGMPPLPKQNFRNGGCLSYEGKLRHVWSFFGWTSVTSHWNDQKSPKYDDAANDPKFIIWVCLKNRMPPKSSGFLSHIPPWANSTIKGWWKNTSQHKVIQFIQLYMLYVPKEYSWHFLFSIMYGIIILPIDELIFFKMVFLTTKRGLERQGRTILAYCLLSKPAKKRAQFCDRKIGRKWLDWIGMK